MVAPSSAIFARFTRCVTAPASTIGFGLSESGAKWCSASVTQSKPSWSASSNCSSAMSSELPATSCEYVRVGTGHARRSASPRYGAMLNRAAFTGTAPSCGR